MKVDFYYWSTMCPIHHDSLCLLEAYKEKLQITTVDIAKRTRQAKAVGMYYPMLTVVNDMYRYFEPLSRKFLDALCRAEIPKEEPYRPQCKQEAITGTLMTLDATNLAVSCACSGGCSPTAIAEKRVFFEDLNQQDYGMIMCDDEGKLLGGVEYVNSMMVPYDIPRHPRTAFLTCVYRSDERYDVKSAPLKALEDKLSATYRDVLVIVDELGTFPNGDLSFFLCHGYEDKGVVQEEKDYCRLHLMYKKLK